ncbi:MAG: GTP-binding protein, partial [bacterium]|nr:GTP-binding protein [bacterium]
QLECTSRCRQEQHQEQQHQHVEEGCGCGHDHDHDHEHGEGCGCGHNHDHDHHHADDVFTSWGVETPHKFTTEEMKEILEKLAHTTEFGTILRAKGIVPNVNGEWIYYDLVPGEYELRTGNPEVIGRLCVIGTNIDKEALGTLFHVV